ncbi:interferon regulatory factor 9 [Osmerus mordax]|uniref:interferon regulatory factor 9 n=1 Tax=Osmerus mordax TaxID=8014 RepID=UPI0035108C8F
MASGRIRSTRRLRNWMVEQVTSGKYSGLIWDDEAKTMFRIPWKHAGKQDFRSDEDGAIFKAWAKFRGKLSDGVPDDPASWKTRMRCALNKSPEFEEVPDRSQLDLSEPYKVYRLVPTNEQGGGRDSVKNKRRPRRLKRSSSESDSGEEVLEAKHMKEEVLLPSPISMAVEAIDEHAVQSHEPFLPVLSLKNDGTNDEIQFNFTIETEPASGDDSFKISVSYIGQEMLCREVMGNDVRITYMPSSLVAPSRIIGGFPRILLPEPPSNMSSSPEAGARHQALATLLPFMERGVMLTSTGSGVYAKRYCQGRVFWTGPHTTSPGPLKMERTTDPILLFSKALFKQELDNFRFAGGTPPKCEVTLCFGEELTATEDPSCKLIIAQITLSWAERQVQDALNFRKSIALLQNLASQSPLGEITLNLEPVSMPCSIITDS